MISRQAPAVITDVNPVALTPFSPSKNQISQRRFFVFKMTVKKDSEKTQTKSAKTIAMWLYQAEYEV